jgi:hypothetical protein
MWQPPPQRLPPPSSSLRWGKVWSQIVATGKCSVCAHEGGVESITIRVYSKRSQVEFRYRVCKEDKKVLHELLATGAFAVSRGLFTPPAETSYAFHPFT